MILFILGGSDSSERRLSGKPHVFNLSAAAFEYHGKLPIEGGGIDALDFAPEVRNQQRDFEQVGIRKADFVTLGATPLQYRLYSNFPTESLSIPSLPPPPPPPLNDNLSSTPWYNIPYGNKINAGMPLSLRATQQTNSLGRYSYAKVKNIRRLSSMPADQIFLKEKVNSKKVPNLKAPYFPLPSEEAKSVENFIQVAELLIHDPSFGEKIYRLLPRQRQLDLLGILNSKMKREASSGLIKTRILLPGVEYLPYSISADSSQQNHFIFPGTLSRPGLPRKAVTIKSVSLPCPAITYEELIRQLQICRLNPQDCWINVYDYIVAPLKLNSEKNYLSLVLEKTADNYIDNLNLYGQLLQPVQESENTFISTKAIWTINQFLSSIHLVHKLTGSGHCRIHPNNICVDENLNIKLADLSGKIHYYSIFRGLKSGRRSLCKIYAEIQMALYNAGSWVAPEMLQSLRKALKKVRRELKRSETKAFNGVKASSLNAPALDLREYLTDSKMMLADVWSAGACLEHLVFPFEDQKTSVTPSVIDCHSARTSTLSSSRIALREMKKSHPSFGFFEELIIGMTQKDPRARLGLKECLHHPIFWDELDLERFLANLLNLALLRDARIQEIAGKLSEILNYQENLRTNYSSLGNSLKKYTAIIERTKALKSIPFLKDSSFHLLLIVSLYNMDGSIERSKKRKTSINLFSKLSHAIICAFKLIVIPVLSLSPDFHDQGSLSESFMEYDSFSSQKFKASGKRLAFLSSYESLQQKISTEIPDLGIALSPATETYLPRVELRSANRCLIGEKNMNSGNQAKILNSGGFRTMNGSTISPKKRTRKSREEEVPRKESNLTPPGREGLVRNNAFASTDAQIAGSDFSRENSPIAAIKEARHAASDPFTWISAVPPPRSMASERSARAAVQDPIRYFPGGEVPYFMAWYAKVGLDEFNIWLEREDLPEKIRENDESGANLEEEKEAIHTQKDLTQPFCENGIIEAKLEVSGKGAEGSQGIVERKSADCENRDLNCKQTVLESARLNLAEKLLPRSFEKRASRATSVSPTTVAREENKSKAVDIEEDMSYKKPSAGEGPEMTHPRIEPKKMEEPRLQVFSKIFLAQGVFDTYCRKMRADGNASILKSDTNSGMDYACTINFRNF